jgi:multicomponent Na+:H+ antiporter subunit E
MRGVALNLLLAVTWALFAGQVAVRELLVGFLVGFGILALFPRALGTAGYVRRSLATLRFTGFFLKELSLANVQVALLALHPRPPLNPMIVAYPMRLEGETAQTLLAATITLMPGTVAMGFDDERRVLYAHAIGLPGAAAARDSIRRVEDALLPVLTRRATPEVHP